MRTATWQRVASSTSLLTTRAVQEMQVLPWFTDLPPRSRADVGLVVQAGLASFTEWLRTPDTVPAHQPEVFGVAPRELARTVTLKQTVQLIRVVVGVLEDQVPRLAADGDERALTEAVLRYSREVGFAAADVYASAAEARGAWDARVESGVVESLVRGEVSEITLSRASSLGWTRPGWAAAIAARLPDEAGEPGVQGLRAHARHEGLALLTGEAGGGLLLVVGGPGSPVSDAPAGALERLAAELPAGPVVLGPVVDGLVAAAGSVAEALAGLGAVTAWPQAPRPVPSSALLAERAVLGDPRARRRLVEEVHAPLAGAGGDLLATVAAHLDGGSSVEATARALFLHPNTVRYRLRKASVLLDRDVTEPRDAQVVRLALVLGRAPMQTRVQAQAPAVPAPAHPSAAPEPAPG